MLNYNALRDAAGDKEFTIVIQMTLEHILVQRSKKIEIEKSNFLTIHTNVTKRANSTGRMI